MRSVGILLLSLVRSYGGSSEKRSMLLKEASVDDSIGLTWELIRIGDSKTSFSIICF